MKQQHTNRTAPLVKSNIGQFFILLLTLVCIATLLFVGVNRLRHTSDELIDNSAHNLWFLMSISRDYTSLTQQLFLYERQQTDYLSLSNSYEVVWSQFNVLYQRPELDALWDIPEARPVFAALFASLKDAETLLLEAEHSPSKSALLAQRFIQDSDSLQLFFNRHFKIADPLFMDIKHRLDTTSRLMFILILVLCLFLICAYLLLIWQLKRNRQLALTDPLTQTANRLWMQEYFNRLDNGTRPYRLIMMDLNGFKAVNDSLGHKLGDQLLIMVAQRLKQLESKRAKLVRLGGDEFLLILNSDDQALVDELAQRLQTLFASGFELMGQVIKLGISLGVNDYQAGQQTSDALAQADLAMYHGKRLHISSLVSFKSIAHDSRVTAAISNS